MFSPIALLLYQKGELVLHSSAIEIGNETNLFSGLSGSGKSTLAYELIKQNNKMVSEDVCSLRFSLEETFIRPSLPLIKLSMQENNKVIEERISNILPDSRGRNFYKISKESFQNNPKRIKNCYFIVGRGNPKIEKINEEVEKFKLIYSNIWRQVPYHSCLKSEKIILKNISNLINSINCYKLYVSKDPKKSINTILEHLNDQKDNFI